MKRQTHKEVDAADTDKTDTQKIDTRLATLIKELQGMNEKERMQWENFCEKFAQELLDLFSVEKR